jgi:lipoprotein
MSVSLIKRKGTASGEGLPATLVAASCKGVHSNRGWEARIPVIENDGEIFVENPEGVGLLLANSSEADSSGYVYAYPIEIRALLAATADVILHIANDASMQSGRTEYFSDSQGWTSVFYPENKYEQLELLTWWFDEQKERFHKEAQEAREYVAFRTSENEDNDGMIVKGIRKRELNPAPFENGSIKHDYQKREDSIEALTAISHEEAMDLIAGIPIDGYWMHNPIRKALMLDWDYASTASVVQLSAPNKEDGAKYVLTLDVNGEWVHPQFDNCIDSTDVTLRARFDAQRALCERSALRTTPDDTELAFVLDQPTTNALLRELAVKRGISIACERKLLELDERNGYDVPLNERQISYEEYLRMGLEDFFKLLDDAELSAEALDPLDKIATTPITEDAPPTIPYTEAPVTATGGSDSSEELADWERELLEEDDPVDPRREVAETIAKVSAVHPGWDTRGCRRGDDVNDLVASPKPSKYAFEEVILWLRTYVEPGYPVIFKGEAAHYITVHMVVYLQRPEGEAGIFNLREDKLADEASILTHVGEDEAVKVTVTHGPSCYALSFDCYKRSSDGMWDPRAGARREEQAFEQFMGDVRASKEPVFYFVTASDNKTRRSLVDGREFLATSLTPADILYVARQRGITMPPMVVERPCQASGASS